MTDTPDSDIQRMVSIIVVGARGRMGTTLIREVMDSDDLSLGAVVDRSGGPGIGQDAGRLIGRPDIGVRVTDELKPRRGCVVVDFSLATATDNNLRQCLEHGVPLVLGTTGLQKSTRELLRAAARDIPIVSAANFSVGVTVLTKIAGLVAHALGEQWDAELLEIHHSHKRDAPSGTALRIAKAVAKATGRDLDGALRTDRADPHARPRERGEIGVAAIRGGDFDKSVGMLGAFQRRYPGSAYSDMSRFWLGNALYGKRDYKEAIAVFRSFVAAAPDHPRAPEALLALANSQAEMKDPKGARKTIEELMKAYPQSEAAQAGKERLASIR